MNAPTTVKVKYVGLKPVKEDNVAGTGVTWFGHGDVHEVPLTAWTKMAKHPDVWARADLPEGEGEANGKEPPRSYVLKGSDGRPDLDLAKLNDKALRAFVKQNEIQGIPDDAKGDDLRAAIYDAVAKASAGA